MAELKKTISLNISERLNALSILNGFKGKLEQMGYVLEDIKQFPITEEEWEKAQRVIKLNVRILADRTIKNIEQKDFNAETMELIDDNAQWTWKDEEGGDKEITIHSVTADYLKAEIKDRDEKGLFTLQDKAFITLQTKLV